MSNNRTPSKHWGESKKRIQYMLTPTARKRLKEVAHDNEMSESEILERFCRSEACTPKGFETLVGPELSAAGWQGKGKKKEISASLKTISSEETVLSEKNSQS